LRKASALDLIQREAEWNMYGDHDSRLLTAIGQVPRTPGPVFVFAHVMTPHLPFVFDQECRPLNRETASTVSKGKSHRYVEQVECLNRMVLGLVATLLRESEVPPVILLQGDHGTKTLHFEKAATIEAIPVPAARERLGAFGAYYLPGHGTEALGDSVTLVNVLGDVLRYYLGAELPREPDDMYLSLGRAPFAFKRVDPAWLARPDSPEGRSRSTGAGPASVPR
jgi:hypothetical protein